MISRQRELELMREAINEAKKSESEDQRIHPQVGAILVDQTGQELCRAHRGHGGQDGHAEYHLFRKAHELGIRTNETDLFVTLEPCTRRGEKKVPCALRVAESGVRRVFIGTLDPNPLITGRGEMFLVGGTIVERFPSNLARELMALNADFFAQHAHSHVPVISPYAGGKNAPQSTDRFKPALAAQREGLLQQSMDLMTGGDGDILLFSGDMSWLRELQVSILFATLDRRRVSIVCDPSKVSKSIESSIKIAEALGATVTVGRHSFDLRGTLVAPEQAVGAAICVERSPALHGLLFQKPHEASLLNALKNLFDSAWDPHTNRKAQRPEISPVSDEELVEALKTGVPAYATTTITRRAVSTTEVRRLPRTLERFKLFRLNQLRALQLAHRVPDAAVIHGSPWPIKPPVVEQWRDSLIVVDGAHRAYTAHARGDDTIDALVVEGVTEPLPADSFHGWDGIEITSAKLDRTARYNNFRADYFRPIARALDRVAAQN